MKKNEASVIIGNIPVNGKDGCYSITEYQEAKTVAVQALEEIQQYRTIGTPEECRAAVEKQTARRPDYEGDGYSDGHLVYDTWICPCCGKHYEVDYDDYDFCPECGQCIDWSDEE